MTELNLDPIINVVQNGIKKGIRVAIENNCYGAAVILILSAIDTMAYLNMPQSQEDVQRKNFVEWADKYIKFPCKEQVTGTDLYGARCGMLHNYATQSKLSREGKCRQIGYMDESVPEVIFNPEISQELVMVSIEALADVFFKGVDQFMIDVFSDTNKAPIAEERFKKIVHTLPYRDNKKE